MPVHVEKIRGKFRLVEPSGLLARNQYGHPLDGGGHASQNKAHAQMQRVNSGKTGGKKKGRRKL